MPIAEIKTVVFTLELFTSKAIAHKGYNASIQYFDLKVNNWILLASEIVADANGKINFSCNFLKTNKDNVRFFELLRTGFQPQCRVVSTQSLKAEIKELVTLGGKPLYNDKNSILTISFGKNYQLINVNGLGIDKVDATVTLFTPFLDADAQNELEIVRKEVLANKTQFTKLNAEYSSLQNTLTESEGKLKNQTEQLNTTALKLKDATALIAQQEQNAKLKEAERTKLVAEIERLSKMESENKVLQGNSLALKTELEKTKEGLKQALEIGKKYEANLKEQTTLITKLNLEYSDLEQVIVQNKKEIDKLGSEILKAETLSGKLQEENKGLVEKIDLLNKKLAEQKPDKIEYKPAAQPVNKVYSSIINEFQKTNELTKDSNFKLANISLNIKTFIEHDDDGVRLQFVDANKLKDINSGMLSDFNIEIKDTSNSSSSTAGLKMPDMIGLTESAARRVTDTLGLRLKSVYQNVNGKVPTGQCFKQSPAKLSELLPNDTITLIFAKENN